MRASVPSTSSNPNNSLPFVPHGAKVVTQTNQRAHQGPFHFDAPFQVLWLFVFFCLGIINLCYTLVQSNNKGS